jgi:3-oxoacyl-[acyl-carrier-protein] synthase-3
MKEIIWKGGEPQIGIPYLTYHLPSTTVAVEEWAEQVNLSEDRLKVYKEDRGLKYLHVAQGKTAGDLAVLEAGRALQKSGLDPQRIDAVIYCHSLYNITPEPASLVGRIQHELKLTKAIGLSISGQYCSSIMAALRVAGDMIRSGSAETVLLVAADSLVEPRAREINRVSLMSDAGSAIIIQTECQENRLIAISNVTQGAFYRFRSWSRRDYENYDLTYFITTVRLVERTLREANLSLDEISLLVPHNINSSSWVRLLKMLKMDESKFFGRNIQSHSHATNSDIVINLTDIIVENRIQKGQYLLLLTAGLGANWGCAVIQH